MNGRELKFTILVSVLILSSLQTTLAEPGEIGDPIVATLGDTNGNIPLRAGNQYFSFTTTADQWYNFSLSASDETGFNMFIYKAGSSSQVGQAIAWIYPDYVLIGDLPSELLIHVNSAEGKGDFTLTITEIEKPALMDGRSFSSELLKGNVYTWEIQRKLDFENIVGTEGINHGDNITIELLENGDDIVFNFSDPSSFTGFWSQVNGVNFTASQDADTVLLLESIAFLFDDDSEMDLGTALENRVAGHSYLDFSETDDEYVMGGVYPAEFDNFTFYVHIDKISGLVNLYSFTMYQWNDVRHQYIAERIKDPSELEDDTTTTTTVPTTPPVATEPTEETTPIDPFWFAIPLMLIPVIRRKSRKSF